MKSKLSIWILAGLLVTGIIGGAIANAATSTSSTPPATGQQVQSATQGNDKAEVKGVEKEGAEKAEPANEQAQEKNLPGGGHQDQGQADHQFEGVE